MTEVKDLTEFIKARMNKPVSEYHPDQLKKQCLELIKFFYKATNTLSVDAKILAFQRDELIKAFKGANNDITIQEAQMAFEMGVALRFGAYFSGCFKTYCQFLNGFRKLPEREMAWKKILETNKPAPTSDKPLTIQEQTYKSEQAAIYFFNHYKETKVITVGSHALYDFLQKKGLINWTDEERDEIANPIKEKYRSEIEWSMKHKIIGEAQKQEILDNLNTNPTLVARIRKAGLAKYFDSLIAEKKELKDLIK